MPEYPKKQHYETHRENISQTVNMSFICLRKGEYIHVDCNGQAVEIKMDDDGRVGICVSEGVAVASFAKIYGN